MNENNIKLNDCLWMALKSIIVGVCVYFILAAIVVLTMWCTSVSEGLITYFAVVCIALGCFVSGLKLGSQIGRMGILVGLISTVLLTLIVLCSAIFISQGEIWSNISIVKIVIFVISGVAGGTVGVNIGR